MTFKILEGVKVEPPLSTYRANYQSSANASTYTYTSVSLGSSGNRVVVVGSCSSGGGTCQSITSITLGGAGMTAIRNNCHDGGTVSETVGLFYIVTSASTATIVVNLSGTRENNIIRIFDVVNYTSAAPAGSAIKVHGSTGSVATSVGSVTSGIYFGGARNSSGVYPAIAGITGGGSYTDTLQGNSTCRSRASCNVTAATINNTSPLYGYSITAAWD